MRVDRLIRQARVKAGLSQAALAARARTSQSAIARYERGVTVPSLGTLARLLRTCGVKPPLEPPRRATPVARPRRRLRSAAGLLEQHRRRLLASARQHGARNVRVFGSVARREDVPGDVDLLVDLEPDRTLLDLIGFQQDAAGILGFPVDVAVPEILKDGIRERVLAEAVPL